MVSRMLLEIGSTVHLYSTLAPQHTENDDEEDVDDDDKHDDGDHGDGSRNKDEEKRDDVDDAPPR